jgi:hypothetical protein
MRRRLALAVALLVMLAGGVALARPGGGQSYSGGSSGGGSWSSGSSSSSYSSSGSWSSSNSSSGGGVGGDSAFSLVVLVIAMVIVAVVKLSELSGPAPSFYSADAMPSRPPPPPELDGLRHFDPDFSQILFEDFLFRLVSQAHRARGRAGALDELAPYLRPEARAALAARQPSGVVIEQVVIGAMSPRAVQLPPAADDDGTPYYCRVAYQVELNITSGGDAPVTTYARERWLLSRAATVTSKPPTAGRAFTCPSCGAIFTSSDGQRCDYCQQVVDNGRFDWVVKEVTVLEEETRAPSLTGTTPERFTDAATIEHPSKIIRLAALRQEDPALTDAALADRLGLIYQRMNAAWNAGDLTPARPFVSDGLYDYLRYWIDAYRVQGLENRLVDARLTSWRGAKLVRDRHYDAFTVRIWATGLDYTLETATGRVVGGSKTTPRPYSEYWTLIRGAAVRGAPRSEPRCPSCGAELAISMAGDCEFCHAHVTAGEFDWVLSKIEQDDSYRG